MTKKQNADRPLTVRLPTPLFEKFRDKCNENYKTMSDALRDCVRWYVKQGDK